ncbi:MAG TPA: hypothetical protein VGV14_01245, partial [Rhodanobacter sp.]|nr:hypothetical protein [Rhodanobacter sp.]
HRTDKALHDAAPKKTWSPSAASMAVSDMLVDERVAIAGTAPPLRKAGKHEMPLRDAISGSICCTCMGWYLSDPR